MFTRARAELATTWNHMRAFRAYSSASAGAARILGKKKYIPDYISPTNSRLLGISLADYLPAECLKPLPSRSGPSNEAFEPLPQGHHLVYFPIQARPSTLHADGTDMDHWPGEPFERRMWAGGEITFRRGWETQLQLDACPATCVESVDDVRLPAFSSNGTSEGNAKAFVDVWRRYSKSGTSSPPAIEERRTLVFFPRESSVKPQTREPNKIVTAPHKPDYTCSLTPTRALLANFSALSYNAHSIHLDTSLAHAEGHRGLLVHGPLSLTLMLAALRGHLVSEDASTCQATSWISYRNIAPLYCDEPLTVCLKEKKSRVTSRQGERKWDIWIESKTGGMAVKGTATTDHLW